MIVDPKDKGAFDPMINRRRIPGNWCRLGFHGWVFGIATRNGGFNLERLERAGFRGHGFLADDF
jgi:hypothetical protein